MKPFKLSKSKFFQFLRSIFRPNRDSATLLKPASIDKPSSALVTSKNPPQIDPNKYQGMINGLLSKLEALNIQSRVPGACAEIIKQKWDAICDLTSEAIQSDIQFAIDIEHNLMLSLSEMFKDILQMPYEERMERYKLKNEARTTQKLLKVERVRDPIPHLENAREEAEKMKGLAEAEYSYVIETKYINQPPKRKFYDY